MSPVRGVKRERGAKPLGVRRSARSGSSSPATRDATTLAFYVEHATAYADATWSLPVDERLRAFAELAPAERLILDVGCGAGRDLAAFRVAGRAAVGVDRSVTLARIATERSSCPVVAAELAEIPFGPRSIGGVWASASLLHLPRAELRQAVASLAALLVRDGLIFVSLKRGEGSVRGSDGRLFTLHTREEVEGVTADCGLVVLDQRVDAGEAFGGGQGWISFVARSS